MELVKYNINEAEISKMSNIYMKLTIENLDDQEGFDSVHTARMVMVKHRCSVDKLRKSANENAQKFIKNNNANAKKLTGLMEPIEIHLKNEEDKVTKEKERIKAREERIEKEKTEKRCEDLVGVNIVLPFFDVAMMTDDEFDKLLAESTTKHEAMLQQLEDEKKARKAEEKRLADERAKLERQKKEQDAIAKSQKEKEKALEAERKKLEDDKKVEKDEIERVAREAKELKKKEEAEAAEIIRQKALRPDRDKLIQYAVAIIKLAAPDVKDEQAQEILDEAQDGLGLIASEIMKQVKEM